MSIAWTPDGVGRCLQCREHRRVYAPSTAPWLRLCNPCALTWAATRTYENAHDEVKP